MIDLIDRLTEYNKDWRTRAGSAKEVNEAIAEIIRLRADRAEAADIIDMLKTVIETELVKIGLPTAATPASALGRSRSFIQYANAAPSPS